MTRSVPADPRKQRVFVGVSRQVWIDSKHCDELASLPKPMLRHFVGHLGKAKLEALDRALEVDLDLDLMLLPPEAMLQ